MLCKRLAKELLGSSDLKNKINVLLLISSLLLIGVLFLHSVEAATMDEAHNQINQAKTNLVSAYVEVSAVEALGANISDFTEELNSASSNLLSATIEYNNGSYGAAYSFATNSITITNQVIDKATELKLTSAQAHSNQVIYTMVGSGIGLVLLAIFSMLGWKLLKKWFTNRSIEGQLT